MAISGGLVQLVVSFPERLWQLKEFGMGIFIPKIGEIFLQFDTAETGTGILQMNPPKGDFGFGFRILSGFFANPFAASLTNVEP